MARYRITYFFRSESGPGWSESWHTTYTSISAIRNLITQYTAYRLAFLHNKVLIWDVRVSDDAVFRDIAFFPTGLPARGNRGGAGAPLAASAVCQLLSGQVFWRFMYCRGNAAEMFLGNNFASGSTSYIQFQAFVNLLKSGGFGIQHKSSPSDAKLVTAYNSSNGLFTVPGIGALSTDTPLAITKVPRSIVAARSWRVATAPAADQFTLQQWPQAVNVAGFGRFRVATPVITSVDDAQPDSVGERRVGRPFGLPRGRAAVIR